MKDYQCTKCGNRDSTRWKLIKDEVLCIKCFSPSGRKSLASRTDIEMGTMSMQDSMESFAK